ncbi:MAG: hypothetical protein V8S34_04520 [Lawsonibacter sp.]
MAAGWRSRFGEIDLIAADGTTSALWRSSCAKATAFGGAGEFVDRRKQQRCGSRRSSI